ncbi:hypothetical protein [Bacillus sp. AFS055030]|uniref:hypothetical protein n=1 Tax=Bacillus sp. AFS055030 TaxID=2033507 RepID=UPI000BFC56EB|nr:hypothetical protein [Bacillus sp. AFS055030]PGL73344.1 hypothetical protein CN925_00595 [Bacillus sp. AFS055030]
MIKFNVKMIVLMFIIFIPLLSLIGCNKNEESSGEIKIFEINNTEEIVGKKNDEEVRYKKHYMILNPPKNLKELKEIIEKYSKEHPIDEEKKDIEGENRIFEMSFYRESKDLPSDWEPDESYMNTDRLEHHKNDLIAYIVWSDAKPEKEYDLYDKSKKGQINKRMRFIGDQLIK